MVDGAVLLGEPEAFHSLGTVDRRAVFVRIPAYRSIVNEKLDRRSPRFHFLLREANLVFRRALEKVARENACDLVVDEGGVSAVGIVISDLTRKVLEIVDPEIEQEKPEGQEQRGGR
jgi:hypothetical protein